MKNLLFCLALILPIFVNAQIPTNGLIGYWPFNGNTLDESVNSNNGNTGNSATLATDRLGNSDSAYEFDGLDDIITISQSTDTTLRLRDDYSIAVWIYPETVKSAAIFHASGSPQPPYRISVSGGGQYIFATVTNGSQNFLSSGSYPTNEWVFMTALVQNDTMKLMVNDSIIGTMPISGTYNYSSTLALIGSQNAIAANTFDGKIDDIRIYNRALSSSELTALYNEGLVSAYSSTDMKYDWNIFATSNFLNLKPSPNLEIKRVEVFGIDGVLLDVYLNKEQQFPIAHYPRGTYIVRILTQDGEIAAKKWVKL